MARLGHHRSDFAQHLIDAHRIHLPAVVIAALDGLLQVASSGLRRKVIGDHLAVATLLFHPGKIRHRNPKGLAVHREADIGSVGVAGRDGDHGTLPHAVQLL
jgi:hypothetical protein